MVRELVIKLNRSPLAHISRQITLHLQHIRALSLPSKLPVIESHQSELIRKFGHQHMVIRGSLNLHRLEVDVSNGGPSNHVPTLAPVFQSLQLTSLLKSAAKRLAHHHPTYGLPLALDALLAHVSTVMHKVVLVKLDNLLLYHGLQGSQVSAVLPSLRDGVLLERIVHAIIVRNGRFLTPATTMARQNWALESHVDAGFLRATRL